MSSVTYNSSIFKTLTIFLTITICSSFFLPKLTTRFCYNSNDPARVNVSILLIGNLVLIVRETYLLVTSI